MRNKHLPKPNIQKGYNAFAFGRITLLFLFFSSLSLPRSLAQLVIDEFNTGAFTVQGPNGTGANASVPTGIIGGVRTVNISDNGSPTTPSTMSLNPGDGYLKLLIGNTSGIYGIGWGNFLGTTPLNLDISAYDHVVLTLSQAPANNQAFINFYLKTSFVTSTFTTLTGAGTYSFPTFGRSNINGIGIYFSGVGLPANSTIHIKSITFTSTCTPSTAPLSISGNSTICSGGSTTLTLVGLRGKPL